LSSSYLLFDKVKEGLGYTADSTNITTPPEENHNNVKTPIAICNNQGSNGSGMDIETNTLSGSQNNMDGKEIGFNNTNTHEIEVPLPQNVN